MNSVTSSRSKGWRAAINGRPAGVLPANYLFMAVRVPAGEHILELAYDEPCLREGLIALGLTGLLMAGLFRHHYHSGFKGPGKRSCDRKTTVA